MENVDSRTPASSSETKSQREKLRSRQQGKNQEPPIRIQLVDADSRPEQAESIPASKLSVSS
jgi:hypothetical protein